MIYQDMDYIYKSEIRSNWNWMTSKAICLQNWGNMYFSYLDNFMKSFESEQQSYIF